MNDNFGERVLQLRKRLAFTQVELAKLFDVDPLTISRWERNKRRPMPVHLKKLARLERIRVKLDKRKGNEQVYSV